MQQPTPNENEEGKPDGFLISLSGPGNLWLTLGFEIFMYAYDHTAEQYPNTIPTAVQELVPQVPAVVNKLEASVEGENDLPLSFDEFKLLLFALSFSARYLFTDAGEKWFVEVHFPEQLEQYGLGLEPVEMMSLYQQFAGQMLNHELQSEAAEVVEEVAAMVDQIFG